MTNILRLAKIKEIAVDLDGTLLVNDFPNFGAPIAANVERIRAWQNEGYKITIFTARLASGGSTEDEIAEYLTEHDIPFDTITSEKPYTASVFIDDRAINVPLDKDWPADIDDKVQDLINSHKESALDLATMLRKLAAKVPSTNATLSDEELVDHLHHAIKRGDLKTAWDKYFDYLDFVSSSAYANSINTEEYKKLITSPNYKSQGFETERQKKHDAIANSVLQLNKPGRFLQVLHMKMDPQMLFPYIRKAIARMLDEDTAKLTKDKANPHMGSTLNLNVLQRLSYIEKEKGGYKVKSEEGKNLGGPYPSKAKAKKRLQQVEYFKHKGGALSIHSFKEE